MSEFDLKMAEHKEALRKGQEIILSALAKEIIDYKYESISDINGSIQSHLERLKGEQYEYEANLDQLTGEGE